MSSWSSCKIALFVARTTTLFRYKMDLLFNTKILPYKIFLSKVKWIILQGDIFMIWQEQSKMRTLVFCLFLLVSSMTVYMEPISLDGAQRGPRFLINHLSATCNLRSHHRSKILQPKYINQKELSHWRHPKNKISFQNVHTWPKLNYLINWVLLEKILWISKKNNVSYIQDVFVNEFDANSQNVKFGYWWSIWPNAKVSEIW